MNLVGRLVALERSRRFGGYTEAQLRARCDDIARHFDLPAEDVYEVTRRYLAIGPDAAVRELADELGVSVDELRRDMEAMRETWP